MSNEWLEVAREALKLPALITDFYGDLLKPGVKQVGKALATIIGLGNTILWPIAVGNERARIALERNLEKYRSQLETIPDEKIIAVQPEVGVPIAEKLSYVNDEELSSLYVNLLAKASTIDTTKFAHPSFVNVINNLCPDEAVYLKELHKKGGAPFIEIRLCEKNSAKFSIFCLSTTIIPPVEVSFPDNEEAYLSNFEGLGLVKIRRDILSAVTGVYEDLESKAKPQLDAMTIDKEKMEFRFERGKIEITPFGKLFMDACLTTLKQS
jgi:hypothetical protein